MFNIRFVLDNFHKALEMMNRAVNNGKQPGAKETVSYLTTMETNRPPPPPPPRIDVSYFHNKFLKNLFLISYFTLYQQTLAEAVRTAAKIPQGFKDLVAKRCEEKGILFVPIPNKYYEAKQVYRLGSNGVQCYIDRNVVFYTQNNSSWLPTSLNKLLDMA